MKARMMKVAALLLAGCMAFTVAYTNPSDGEAVPVADGNVRAGIAAEFTIDMNTGMQGNLTVASGVTGTVSDYLSDALMTAAEVKETDTLTTAAGQEDVASGFGYLNLGIAHADGNLNVREMPGTDAKLVGKMPDDAACEILGVEGDWTKVKSGEVEGYVKSEYLLSGSAALARAQEIQRTMAKVTADTLYVREQPTTESGVVTRMPRGEELEVLETLDGWVKVNVDSDQGYVSADYVEITNDLPKAMTMTEVRYGQGVSDVRVDLVQYATQFVGNPYVWGGTSLTRGADCSGFVLSVFAKYGFSLPHSSAAQGGYGTKISASEAQPGDLFFYGNGSRINHVAIYIGNGQVVHASSARTGIKISGAYYRNPVKVTRLIND